MKLIYFVQYFPPESASGLPLVMDMLEGFALRGWNVDVYTTTPTRGVTKDQRNEYKHKRKEVLFDGRVTVHRMPLYREGTGFIQRSIRYSIFSCQCLVKGLLVPADAIFTGGGPPTRGIVAGLIHKLTSKKVIFNPQDLFPDSLIYSGTVQGDSAVVKAWRIFERFSYNNADVIITISNDMKETISERCKISKEVQVIRNWIDTESVIPVERNNNTLFDELKLPRDKFYVTYAGNLGKMQGIETLVSAAELLKDKDDIQFVIFGNGSEEKNIRTLMDEKKLKNLHLFPLQPPNLVSEVYSMGDVSVVLCKLGTGKAGMPSKTWTIMGSGTGIIASFDLGGEMERIINEAECGLCVEAENAVALSNAILKCYNAPATVSEWGKNARKYAEINLSKKTAVDQYINSIEKTMR